VNENACNSQSNKDAINPDSSNILELQTCCHLIHSICQGPVPSTQLGTGFIPGRTQYAMKVIVEETRDIQKKSGVRTADIQTQSQ
jgi:hypothetical protein